MSPSICSVGTGFIGVMLLTMAGLTFQSVPQEKAGTKGQEQLTVEEEAKLRSIVYKDGFVTTVEPSGTGIFVKKVAVKELVIELHKKKPVATLRLLSDIARGASPRDALAASALAVALERDPAVAALLIHENLDDFDTLVGPSGKTIRQKLVHMIGEFASKREKKVGTSGPE